jgi:hypothetical protein
MDCSAMVFMDEFLNSLTFSLILLVLGCPKHLSSLADTLPALKSESHSKTNTHLEECYPKAS